MIQISWAFVVLMTCNFSSAKSDDMSAPTCSIIEHEGVFFKLDNLLGENRGLGEVKSYENCLGYCMDAKNNCKSINYLSDQQICSLHSSSVDPKVDEKKFEIIIESVHARFECSIRMLQKVNDDPKIKHNCNVTKYNGLSFNKNPLKQETATSIEHCVQLCVDYKKELCYGVDFKNDQHCELHGDSIKDLEKDKHKYQINFQSIHASVDCGGHKLITSTPSHHVKTPDTKVPGHGATGDEMPSDRLPDDDSDEVLNTEPLQNCTVIAQYRGVKYEKDKIFNWIFGNETKCNEQCMTLWPFCKSVVFVNNNNLNWNKCEFHSSAPRSLKDNTVENKNCIHTVIDCPHAAVHRIISGCKTVKFGGISYKSKYLHMLIVDSFEKCIEECIGYSDGTTPCVGVDLEYGKLCELHGGTIRDLEVDKGKYEMNLNSLHASVECMPPKELNKTVGCGKQHKKHLPILNQRILNGRQANPHSWPWQLRLLITDGKEEYKCGGSLIRVKDNVEKSDMIITAAHCLADSDLDKGLNFQYADDAVKIFAGKHHFNNFAFGQQIRNSVKIFVRQQYLDNYGKMNCFSGDLGVVFTEEPIFFSRTIRPICLPNEGDEVPVGKTCVATGWGINSTTDKESTADELQQIQMQVHEPEFCRNKHMFYTNETEMLCAGGGQHGTAKGDSGGPLQCRLTDDGPWILYGATSFGEGWPYPTASVPRYYTRVSNYVSWINDLKQHSKIK